MLMERKVKKQLNCNFTTGKLECITKCDLKYT